MNLLIILQRQTMEQLMLLDLKVIFGCHYFIGEHGFLSYFHLLFLFARFQSIHKNSVTPLLLEVDLSFAVAALT